MVLVVPEVAAAGGRCGVVNAFGRGETSPVRAVVAERVFQSVAFGVLVPAARISSVVGAGARPLVVGTPALIREYRAAGVETGALRSHGVTRVPLPAVGHGAWCLRGPGHGRSGGYAVVCSCCA